MGFITIDTPSTMSTPIPQPPGVPLLGNIFDVDPNNTWWSLKTLAEKYGESALLNIDRRRGCELEREADHADPVGRCRQVRFSRSKFSAIASCL